MENAVGWQNPLPKDPGAKVINSLNWTIYLKKHKGKSVREVLAEDPGYLLFIKEKVSYLDVSPDILAMAVEKLEEQKQGGPFRLDVTELEKHNEIIQALANGLDSYANADGARQVHGINNDIDVHASLTYIKRLTKYLVGQAAKTEANAPA